MMPNNSRAGMIRAVLLLRDAYPDHGRPPWGLPLWHGAVLLVMAFALLLLAQAGVVT